MAKLQKKIKNKIIFTLYTKNNKNIKFTEIQTMNQAMS